MDFLTGLFAVVIVVFLWRIDSTVTKTNNILWDLREFLEGRKKKNEASFEGLADYVKERMKK